MNVLSLFSGIGGLELGLERAGMTVVGQVEINPYATRVLERHWPNVLRHDDVRTTINWWQSAPRPPVDVVCGGFPCTDISNAGGRIGITGPQSSLWKPMLDVIRALRPHYAVIENVSSLVVRGLDVVLTDLAAIGFDAEWTVVRASDHGALHERERIFIVAYPQSIRRQRRGSTQPVTTAVEPERCRPEPLRPWTSEPQPVGVAYGIPHRVERLTALGNAVVPQVAEHIGHTIMEAAA